MDENIQISLPPWAAKAIELLEQAGYEAWCVGGCVRDFLLGLSPKDWDVTTSATPEEMKGCFPGYPVLETGLKHGTLTVLFDRQPVEITTYRADGSYLDHRHPQAVTFSRSLEDDLSRRDFTVNAMAYHPKRGLRDAFGGQADLKSRTLRCVGEPERRFREDALRILRCLRFASVLDFSIDSSTAEALQKEQNLLENVSRERIREELTKLLCGQRAAEILRAYSPVLFFVLPELLPMKDCTQEHPSHCFGLWEHTLHTVDAIPPTPILRWAALLHDSGKPEVKSFGPDGTAHFYGHAGKSEEIAERVLDGLRFSNGEKEKILSLIHFHSEYFPLPEIRVKKLLARLGTEGFENLLALVQADWAALVPGLLEERLPWLEEVRKLAQEIIEQQDCLTLRDLAVNGNDLLALGFSSGRSLGETLNKLLEEVLENRLSNERQALLRRAKDIQKGRE